MRRTLPSPTAHRIVIGERHGMPRIHASTAQAFPDERSRWLERHDRPGLLPVLLRAVRRLLESKGSL